MHFQWIAFLFSLSFGIRWLKRLKILALQVCVTELRKRWTWFIGSVCQRKGKKVLKDGMVEWLYQWMEFFGRVSGGSDRTPKIPGLFHKQHKAIVSRAELSVPSRQPSCWWKHSLKVSSRKAIKNMYNAAVVALNQRRSPYRLCERMCFCFLQLCWYLCCFFVLVSDRVL